MTVFVIGDRSFIVVYTTQLRLATVGQLQLPLWYLLVKGWLQLRFDFDSKLQNATTIQRPVLTVGQA